MHSSSFVLRLARLIRSRSFLQCCLPPRPPLSRIPFAKFVASLLFVACPSQFDFEAFGTGDGNSTISGLSFSNKWVNSLFTCHRAKVCSLLRSSCSKAVPSSFFRRGETVGWRKYAKNRKKKEEEEVLLLVPFPRRRRCEIRQSLRPFLGDYGCLFLELAELIRDWIFGKFRSCFSSPSARRRRRRKGLKKLSQTREEKRKKKRRRGSVFGCWGRRWHSQERKK